MRPKLKPSHFHKLLTYLSDVENKEEIVGYLSKVKETKPAETSEKMDTTGDENGAKKEETKLAVLPATPEVSLFLHLLAVILLLDDKQVSEALTASTSLLERTKKLPNKTSVFPLSSKNFFYYSRCMELSGRSAEIRPTLLAAYKTATLKHDVEGQVTLLNLILRNYIHANLIDQADKFLSKITLPEAGQISNNQMARYLPNKKFFVRSKVKILGKK